MNIDQIITEEVKQHIEHAIQLAEAGTSAEVRVHIEDECKEDTMDRASHIFAQLEMHKTALRNGVLIYAALGNKKMAIIGDAGINAHMQQQDWNVIKEHILEQFKAGHIEAGFITGVHDVGEKIKMFFPIQTDDRNELPNRVTTNKDV